MAEKKGFIHYLSNPAEAAKKLFPFIDVDAMMASNRERQIALGNNPDVASDIMGAALNPVGLATGYGASKLIGGLLKNAYTGMSKRNIGKDLLSDESFKRYKSNFKYHLDEMNKTLDTEKIGLESLKGDKLYQKHGHFSDDFLAKKLSGIGKRRKEIREALNSLDEDGFRMMYDKIIQDKISKTSVKFNPNLDPSISGQYIGRAPIGEIVQKTKPFQYNPRIPEQRNIYKGLVEINPNVVKNWGTTGVHELKHSIQSALKGYIKKAEDILDWDAINKRTKAKMKISRIMGQSKDVVKRIDNHVKYISKPHELSARLTEYRLNPSKNSSAYKDLMHLFGSEKKIKEAADTIWAGAPAGLIDYARKE